MPGTHDPHVEQFPQPETGGQGGRQNQPGVSDQGGLVEGHRDAVKTAVMCEDAARTLLLARTFGELTRLDQADIDALHDRYQNVYGQR